MSETVVRRTSTVYAAPSHNPDNDNDEHGDADTADDVKSDDHPHAPNNNAETQSLLRRSVYSVAQTPGLALRLLGWLASSACACCGGGGGSDSGFLAGGGGKGGMIDLKVHRDNLLKLERHVKDVEREMKELQSQFDRSAEALERAARAKQPYSDQMRLATTVKHYKTLLERKSVTHTRLSEARDMLHRFIEQTKDDMRQSDISVNVTQMTQQMELLGDRAESVKEALQEVADIAAEHAAVDEPCDADAAEPNVLEAMLRHVYSSKNDKRLNVIQDAVLDAEASAAVKQTLGGAPSAPRRPLSTVSQPSSSNLLALLDE